ncbi:SdpI family protein [Streptomonospora litoralis]|uniref:SdpI/YhfL protein family n=1 Tax=Streptomonospora litoralis TaxID=2498135 RepID=A0A4P6Q0J5_9ACTN|nr:SdpI family protein [Streptomonospora litoralis]QBI52691.1 hypothetical protein EKD16_04415 [Streptomonospora litoralis]
MDAAAVLVSAAVGVVLVAGAAHWIKYATANGRLNRNLWIGIRTGATLSSDAAWESGHSAAAPWLTACSYTGYAASAGAIALAVYAGTRGISTVAASLVALCAFVGVVVLVVIAAVVAHRRASSVQGNR